jgi:hypothetical protein
VLQQQISNEVPGLCANSMKGICVEHKHLPTDKLERLTAFLQAHNLVDVTVVMLNYASAWGFIGGQILWMLTPFFGESKLNHLAELLENPEAMKELRDYLVR